jgi:hypothetical protein
MGEITIRQRQVSIGYADVNGIKLYHEIYGQGEPWRDHAVAFGSQLPPTGSVRDLHPQSIIHVQRTRASSSDALRMTP